MPLRLTVHVLAFAAVVALQTGARAQTLALSLFERYLEPLRVQAGIPGLSAAILLDGQVVWERGLGLREVEGSHPARPDTPYPIADLTQTVTATLLLKCAEHGGLQVDHPLGNWLPEAQWAGTTLRQIVTHGAPATLRGFEYNPSRFALLAHPIEVCAGVPFRKLVARELLERLAMIDAVPGQDIATVPLELRQLFDEATLARYAATLQRMAVPYKVDKRARARRSELPPLGLDGAGGLIASVRDLAKFDAALDAHQLLRPLTLADAWTPPPQNGAPAPFGIGWFVQTYQNEQLVWHFGYLADAYSSLILKVPGRRLTLILLANSDGLSAPFSLHEGDITSSLFARTFLRVFLSA